MQHGIYLAYRPIYLASGSFESFIVYLINYNKASIEICYEHKINGANHFKVNTLLEKEQCYELGIISFEDCNEKQFIVLKGTINDHKKIAISKKIQAKVFFKSFSKIPFIEKEGIIVLIYQNEKNPENPESPENKPMTVRDIKKIRSQLMGGNLKESKNIISNASEVIDLHWDKLSLRFPSVLKDEVYDYQIQVFEKELDIAIADGRTSITFIHGIGSGKLKNAIFAYLASHPFVDHYSNDYDQRYGYGATKVLLKHK